MRALAFAIGLVAAAPLAANQLDQGLSLAALLDKAGERVERFFLRAQSLVCLEKVQLHPLSASLSNDGMVRTVESELQISWTPGKDGAPATEAKAVRQLLRVNGKKPRHNDWNNCTTPEQQAEEPQPLSLLLLGERAKYRFALAGKSRLDRQDTLMLDYWLLEKATAESSMVEGRDNCVRFDVEGGLRGRIWLDATTYDVLRLDQRLIGMVDIPLPLPLKRRPGSPYSWTMERWDTSIRFKPTSFANPDETLMLPASLTSLQVTRGAGTPRLRTITEYTNYQRFLTGGRVVGE